MKPPKEHGWFFLEEVICDHLVSKEGIEKLDVLLANPAKAEETKTN